jgi:transcriptional regulator with XRE-family HTH domain
MGRHHPSADSCFVTPGTSRPFANGATKQPMTTQNGRAFNEWLRAQLKAKKMSQRQLAQQSGVDHSTISRLIRGDRMPSLGTATKLARGLRELRDDADTPQYLGLMSSGSANPTARVEYALRSDDVLGEPQVRQIMEYYLAVRMRRLGRTYGSGVEPTRPLPSPYLRGGGAAPSPIGAGSSGTSTTTSTINGQTRLGTVRSSNRPPSGRPTSRY